MPEDIDEYVEKRKCPICGLHEARPFPDLSLPHKVDEWTGWCRACGGFITQGEGVPSVVYTQLKELGYKLEAISEEKSNE